MRKGLHVQADRSIELAVRYCGEVQPAMMKWLEPNAEVIRRCKAVSPQTKHVARVVWEPQEHTLGNYGSFQDRTLEKASHLVGLVDYWEGWNEHITPSTPEGEVKAFAAKEIGLAKRLNELGVGCLVGGFSTGVLDESRFRAFDKAWRYMQSVGPGMCALHFHEYAGAYIGLFVETPDGLNQWDHAANRFTGWSTDMAQYLDPKLQGWLCLRYRKLIPLLDAAGYDRVRFFITEGGIDDTNPRPGGANLKGWRDYNGTEWSRGPMGDFASQMQWLAWQESHDHRLLGSVMYGFGTIDERWASFDLSRDPGMLDSLMRLQKLLPQGHIGGNVKAPAPAPVPVPPPPGETGGLVQLLADEFGDAFIDERGTLPATHEGENGDFGPMGKVDGYVIHHTAGQPTVTWEAIARGHLNRGFAGIGYHLGIRNNKVSYLGDVGTARAHTRGENDHLIGIAVAGNFEEADPQPSTLALLRRLISVLDVHTGATREVTGHGDWTYTACPGEGLSYWVPLLNERKGDTPSGVRWPKVVWALEEAARILSHEDLHDEHDAVMDLYVTDAIRRRDQ